MNYATEGSREYGFTARVPGSKSLTNRALIIASHRPGETEIRNALHSDDTDHLADCLNNFGGLAVNKSPAGYVVNRKNVQLTAPLEKLYISGAGTPARFLLAFASMASGTTTVGGNVRLNERPMADILRAFDGMGVNYQSLDSHDHLPISVTGSVIQNDEWTVSGAISSQFLSSLILLASQQFGRSITIRVRDRLVSRPYVLMTISMLKESGITVKIPDGNTFVVESGIPQQSLIEVEPDASAMSYFLAAAAVTGTTVTIPSMKSTSSQGDVGFAKLLEKMGCNVAFNSKGLTLSSDGLLKGIDADMDDMPDTALTLAVAAAFAKGPTRITNIGNLRVKECDRIHAAAAELTRLGVAVEEGNDYLVVKPREGAFAHAEIETYDDHRVAMAFSLIKLIQPSTTIKDPGCVAKSFPNYWNEFERFAGYRYLVAA